MLTALWFYTAALLLTTFISQPQQAIATQQTGYQPTEWLLSSVSVIQ